MSDKERMLQELSNAAEKTAKEAVNKASAVAENVAASAREKLNQAMAESAQRLSKMTGGKKSRKSKSPKPKSPKKKTEDLSMFSPDTSNGAGDSDESKDDANSVSGGCQACKGSGEAHGGAWRKMKKPRAKSRSRSRSKSRSKSKNKK